MSPELKWFLLIFVLFAAVMQVSAQETMTIDAVTFEDDLDRKVVIPSPVTSVITLAPSLTETLYFLGAEDLISAVDINSDFPETINDLPKVTGWDTGINYEKILSLEPDIVFASEMTSMEEIPLYFRLSSCL